MATITNVEDLKKIYKRRVPKMFYDYAESVLGIKKDNINLISNNSANNINIKKQD